jgi:hypothetical protein
LTGFTGFTGFTGLKMAHKNQMETLTTDHGVVRADEHSSSVLSFNPVNPVNPV